MNQQPVPYEQASVYSMNVQALWFQDLVLILLAIGMVVYFIKVGPVAFFEKVIKE